MTHQNSRDSEMEERERYGRKKRYRKSKKKTPKDKDIFGEGIEMFAKKLTFFNQTAICRQPSLKQ